MLFLLPVVFKTSYASKIVEDRVEIEEFFEKMENETVTTEEIEYFVDIIPDSLKDSIERELLEVVSKIKFNEFGRPYLKENLTFYNDAGNDKVKETIENMSEANARNLRSFLKQRFAITLAALIELLISLGFAWLVNEILNFGVRPPCQKYSDTNSIFRKYCKTMGSI
ncbi:MAG: hypothetical protein Q4D88_02965 [Anaerococcus sp.]|nr:hypothetical protein [Anaerococcus sp.]